MENVLKVLYKHAEKDIKMDNDLMLTFTSFNAIGRLTVVPKCYAYQAINSH